VDLLRRLSEAHGLSGHEDAVCSIVRDELSRIGIGDVRTDVLGNVIAHVPGDGRRVVITAHMDEVGFLVKAIEKDTGFLRVHRVGGGDPRALSATRMVVHSARGEIVACTGIHPINIITTEDARRPLEWNDFYVDTGLESVEVHSRVRVGDPITAHQTLFIGEGTISGKALDDRIGVYACLRALEQVRNPRCDLYFVATVQEEVGLRGAQVAGFALKPDIAVAIDVTTAADLPGIDKTRAVTHLGDGVAIKLADKRTLTHPKINCFLVGLADREGIPWQYEILPGGGSDAGALQLAQQGAAVAGLDVPLRYCHSPVELAHQRDVQATVDLLRRFLEHIDEIDLAG